VTENFYSPGRVTITIPTRPATNTDPLATTLGTYRFVRTSTRGVFKFYDGGTLIVTVDPTSPNSVNAIIAYVQGHSLASVQGWWQDLMGAIDAGASDECNKATFESAVFAAGTALAAWEGSASGVVTGLYGFWDSYGRQLEKCKVH
jgi:hypothetical protein